jgi:hypothetical protein
LSWLPSILVGIATLYFIWVSALEKYDKEGEKLFIHGFKISFWETAEKNYFGFAVIENISHNDLIIKYEFNQELTQNSDFSTLNFSELLQMC